MSVTLHHGRSNKDQEKVSRNLHFRAQAPPQWDIDRQDGDYLTNENCTQIEKMANRHQDAADEVVIQDHMRESFDFLCDCPQEGL